MNRICLYCNSEWVPPFSWAVFFTAEVPEYLCPDCKERLERITGKTCGICGRPLEHLDAKYVSGNICYDCVRWEEDPEWKGVLRENRSLYLYNAFLKELISRFKFRGDYALAKAFAEDVKQAVNRLDYDVLAPIPLSGERHYERGFNQSEALLVEAGFKPAPLLERIHGEKQSKKSRTERIRLKQVFRVKKEADVAGKKILLVDDIYTTGSTLRHAAKALKEAGARSVSSFTLARG